MEKIPQIRRLRLPLRDQLWCNGAKGIEFKQCCHSVPLCRHLEKSRRRNGARTFRTFTGPNSAPISSHSKIPERSRRFAYKLLDFFPWEPMPTRRSWTFVDCRATARRSLARNYIDKFCVGNYISTESVGVQSLWYHWVRLQGVLHSFGQLLMEIITFIVNLAAPELVRIKLMRALIKNICFISFRWEASTH